MLEQFLLYPFSKSVAIDFSNCSYESNSGNIGLNNFSLLCCRSDSSKAFCIYFEETFQFCASSSHYQRFLVTFDYSVRIAAWCTTLLLFIKPYAMYIKKKLNVRRRAVFVFSGGLRPLTKAIFLGVGAYLLSTNLIDRCVMTIQLFPSVLAKLIILKPIALISLFAEHV